MIPNTRFLSLIGLIMVLSAGSTRQSNAETIRIATYNASLYGKHAGEIRKRLEAGNDKQAQKVAAIVQTIRPDVLLINEIDYDEGGVTAKLLASHYFAKPQGERGTIDYPYVYAAPSNTGVDSHLDLNANDRLNEPNDAFGFGVYPGQYSMAVFSRFPILTDQLRTFQMFLWKDLPNAQRPRDPRTKQFYYADETWEALRLSSKNHIDVPIRLNDLTIHVLASHPTPPVFDGPEDRNGCRNHDEIAFWQYYIDEDVAKVLVDDSGKVGGLSAGESFVIMGDLNTDPADGDSRRDAIRNLMEHPRTVDPKPASEGAAEAAKRRKAGDGDPRYDTAKFRGGNMRVDYVLPSQTFKLTNAGVYWPKSSDEGYSLISASDHRMVWIEVEVP
ncbi:MAG: endonuclease/exonuclease/phosphatase family protein [Rubripirellula sp.]